MSAGISLFLAINTGASAIGAVAALIAIFWIGSWGLALSAWLALTANLGWRLMKMNPPGMPVNNATLAGVMVIATFAQVGIRLLFEPPGFSAWWGLAVPVVFIVLSVALLWVCGAALDLINRKGR